MKLVFLFVFSFVILSSTAQVNGNQLPDTSQYPYWIQMMQDPQAPFHATVSALKSILKIGSAKRGMDGKYSNVGRLSGVIDWMKMEFVFHLPFLLSMD